jgi:hypothetical protein
MNQRALIAAAVVFVAIVGGMFGYAHLKKTELAQEPTPFVVTPPVTEQERVLVNAVHFFENGQHTVIGDLMMPTPCHLIQSDVRVAESMPEQVTIELSIVNNAEVCAQVLTPQRFRVDFAASEKATISLTLDGKQTTLNLRDAESGETPDDLGDIFIKG